MTSRTRRRVGTVLLAAALAPGLATVPVFAEPAAALSGCQDWTSNDPAWYDGLSAGAIYDRLFSKGPELPGLPTYTPQSLAVIPNWNSRGDGLLLIGAHNHPYTSRIFGVNTRTGERIGTVKIDESSHLGGMAVVGNWLFTQGLGAASGPQPVRKYSVSSVRRAMRVEGDPVLKPSGSSQTIYGASFMASSGGYLWSGRYNWYGSDRMYKYAVTSGGTLVRQAGSWKVPPRTQGLLVTATRFVFSATDGLGRGRLFVVRKAGDYTRAAGRCFRTPSLPQGLTSYRGTAYLNFESGASQFGTARNNIESIHKAAMDRLTYIG